MGYSQQLLEIQREQKEREERELDELVAESQAEYDRTAEFLGFQEPKEETDGEEENN